MRHIYQRDLDLIIDFRRKYRMGIQPPCSEEQIERLKMDTEELLYCKVPDQYIEFLRRINGLCWNGLVIYASAKSPLTGFEHLPERFIEGLVDANILWRGYEINEDYLVFAESGISLYVYNLIESQYEEQDQSCREVVKVVPDFDHLIASALSDHMLPEMEGGEETFESI